MVMMLGARFPICSDNHASDGFVQSPERAVTSMCANRKASDWSRKKKRKKIPPQFPQDCCRSRELLSKEKDGAGFRHSRQV